MSTAIQPRARLARLTVLSVTFCIAAALAGVLVLVEVVVAPELPDVAGLSFLYGRDIPGRSILLAVVFGAAAVVMGLSAAYVRVFFQVLRRDRRIPLADWSGRTPGVLGPGALASVTTSDGLPVALPTQSEIDAVGTAVRITVLVPAHNERLVIALALRSLQEQTRPPDRVIVVADNCTTTPSEIARSLGAR